MAGAMSTGDFIRSVFPSTVNREGKIFGALLANDTETGTIERIFNDIEVVRDDWYRTSPYAMHDTTYVEGRSSSGQLSTTFNFLSVLQRNAYDDDATEWFRYNFVQGSGARSGKITQPPEMWGCSALVHRYSYIGVPIPIGMAYPFNRNG